MAETKRSGVAPIAFVALAIAACFALTVAIFFPGVMTYDARYIHQDIGKGVLGDWQSPVMTVIWSWIDSAAPGAGSMFLLIAALYWLAFGLLAFAMRERTVSVLALLVAALSPPAFVFVGMIWRDVLFADVWLLAAALAFIAASKNGGMGLLLRFTALLLLATGVLLRPNALPAASLLAAYLAWPRMFDHRKALIIFLPLIAVGYGLIQTTYYMLLHAERQHPLHSLLVFDLAGVTHFSGDNAFPTPWTTQEFARLTGDCYTAEAWDRYWTGECSFVMARIEREARLFGTPVLTEAWRKAVLTHPAAWLRHRFAFARNFLFGANQTMWTIDIDEPSRRLFNDNAAFQSLRMIHDALKPTPLFRVATWLVLCCAVAAFAWRRRDTPGGAFALGVGGSAIVYVATFFIVGVASDFRYALWSVVAGLTGAIVLAFGDRRPAHHAHLPDAPAVTPSARA